MAITMQQVQTGMLGVTSPSTSYNLGNLLSGRSGQCIIAGFVTGVVANPTVAISGGGITWTFQRRDENWWGTSRGQALYTGIGTVDGSDVTISVASSSTIVWYSIFALLTVDSAPIVQFVNGSVGFSPHRATLATFGNANNATVGLIGTNAKETLAPESGLGFTAIDTLPEPSQTNYDLSGQTMWQAGNQTTVGFTDGGGARGIVYGLEIKASAGTVDHPITIGGGTYTVTGGALTVSSQIARFALRHTH